MSVRVGPCVNAARDAIRVGIGLMRAIALARPLSPAADMPPH